MSIELKQFAGSMVTPQDDARLYNFILSGNTGIVEGVEVTHLGANQLKVSAGWGICQGRMFTVEEETVNAVVSANGEIKGRLLINIDVSADVPAVFTTQAASALPEPVQEDINGSGTVYQIPITEYTVNELALSSAVDVAPRLVIAVKNAAKVREVWFDKTDADGNLTDTLHAHWYEDEDTGEILT